MKDQITDSSEDRLCIHKTDSIKRMVTKSKLANAAVKMHREGKSISDIKMFLFEELHGSKPFNPYIVDYDVMILAVLKTMYGILKRDITEAIKTLS